VAERTVSRLLPKRRTPPLQTRRTFLTNHVRDLVSVDFFTVPTAHLRVLFVLVVLAHHRRRVLHFNVTEHPAAAWTAQQIVEAFLEDSAPSYLLRDRDQVYGQSVRQRVRGMRTHEVLTVAQSPWQNPFVERLIGSVRRECLDHVLVLSERHVRRILTRYFAYCHHARTRLVIVAATAAGPTGEIHGIDPAPEMVALAWQKAARAGVKARLDVGVIEALPYPPDYFDVVLSSLMLHHLPDEVKRRGLAEIHRVLRPAGRLVAVDFGATPRNGIDHFLCVLRLRTGWGHAEHLRAMLRETGFAAVEIGPTGHRALAFVRGRKPHLTRA
jgi:putative transposase